MLEIKVLTTDQKLVDDLNSSGIEGVKAKYRPEMAFDSAEHLLQIVVEAGSMAALKAVAEWLLGRFKEHTPRDIVINNKNVESSEIVNVVNIYIDNQGKAKSSCSATALMAGRIASSRNAPEPAGHCLT